MIPFISIFLNWLGGGVLNKVLDHLEQRKRLENDKEKLKTEVTISEIQATLKARQEQAAIIKAQLGHPIAWIPRFLIELSVAAYVMGIILDKILDLPGEIQDLPPQIAAILVTVIGGMYIKESFRK